MDGDSENRSDTVSVFNGPPPVIRVLKSENEEVKFVGAWFAEQSKAGVLPHEFGVFVRSAAQVDRAKAAVKESGLSFKILEEVFLNNALLENGHARRMDGSHQDDWTP